MQASSKVVHLTSVHKPFDVRIFHKECKSLARSGNQVILIAPHTKDEEFDSVEIKGIPPTRGRIARMLKTAWLVYTKALRQAGDVYHFHDPELIPVGLLLAARGNVVVYDIHEDVPADILHKPYIPKRLRRLVTWCVRVLENRAARRFSGLVAATPTIAERFQSINPNTCVVHNFPVPEEIAPKSVTWKDRPLAAAYIGTISERRGITQMMSAVAKLNSNISAELVLAGPLSPDRLHQDLKVQPEWKNVRYLGVLGRKGIAELLSQVRVGLLVLQPEPNLINAMPIKLFEYMAAGVPVIASDFPLWRNIIGGAKCGILVDPLDAGAIARSLEWLLTHEAEAQEMGRRGMQAVHELYNWRSQERVLLDFYSRLLHSPAN